MLLIKGELNIYARHTTSSGRRELEQKSTLVTRELVANFAERSDNVSTNFEAAGLTAAT